jgi:uncharacterized protein
MRLAKFRNRVLAITTIVLSTALGVPAAGAGDASDCNASDQLLKTDPGRAVAACRRLAETGDVVAEYNLALLYYAGQGLPQNDSEAARWFRKAAEQGDAPAEFELGQLYEDGHGVEADAVEAAHWYRKSAEQGYVYAQSQLGFMYGNAAGIPRDYVQADLWLSLAAAAGDPDAADYRSFMEQGMAPAELAEARRLFNAWKMKRAGTDQPAY